MKFRDIASYSLATALLVSPACATRQINNKTDLTPEDIYRNLNDRKLVSTNFMSGGWAYYVESVSAEKLYIAGVKSAGGDLDALFEGRTDKKGADLMIIACGPVFGDDSCDFYSPLNEIPRTGNKISEADRKNYQPILRAAVLAR